MVDIEKATSIVELLRLLSMHNVPEEKYAQYTDRYLEQKARRSLVPLSGMFELTPLCNFNCRMCYIHLSESQFPPKSLLSADSWKSLIDQAHSFGMLRATLTGGECLTYPSFDEVYLHLWEKGIQTSILTNGYLIDRARINFFLNFRPRLIRVSIYGSSEDEYESVTGKRAFDTVRNNICEMKEANLPLKIVVTPNKYMKDSYFALIQFIESLHIPYNINSHLFPPRENTGRTLEELSDDQYISIFRFRDELKGRVLRPIDYDELPEENHEGVISHGIRCGAGRSTFTIHYDGSMSPCIGLSDCLAVDTKTEGFLSAWKKNNLFAEEYLMPKECIECEYSKKCLLCPAIHKKALQGHSDPEICQRTKRMISSGLIPFQVEP